MHRFDVRPNYFKQPFLIRAKQVNSHRDHWIETYKINPPIGRTLGYGEKPRIVDTDANGRREMSLTEHFGRTEEEARSKAQVALKAWLDTHTRPGS